MLSIWSQAAVAVTADTPTLQTIFTGISTIVGLSCLKVLVGLRDDNKQVKATVYGVPEDKQDNGLVGAQASTEMRVDLLERAVLKGVHRRGNSSPDMESSR